MINDATSLDFALTQIFGSGCSIKSRRSVSGGDINRASGLTLSTGHRVFLKENSKERKMMFAAEARGLMELTAVSAISGDSEKSSGANFLSVPSVPSVPVPLAWGSDGPSSFLLMEFVEPSGSADGREFGRALAELHRRGRSRYCGLDYDNWIGSTVQVNGKNEDWFGFFAENRLLYQWRLARNQGYGENKLDKAIESLCNHLEDLIPGLDEGGASLLHGDLWGGNWLTGSDGRAMLIDPAVYYGHREADLAMTELFGGFPGGFKSAYQEAWPLEDGFNQRRDVYNLYHLLNHLNLFGSSYLGSVQRIVMDFA